MFLLLECWLPKLPFEKKLLLCALVLILVLNNFCFLKFTFLLIPELIQHFLVYAKERGLFLK